LAQQEGKPGREGGQAHLFDVHRRRRLRRRLGKGRRCFSGRRCWLRGYRDSKQVNRRLGSTGIDVGPEEGIGSS